MARSFDIPLFYRAPLITGIKRERRDQDSRKKDLSPTVLDFGKVVFKIARHFGFCFGVENAIEIAYRALKENPGKRVFLLSEMIHNPSVNQDLTSRGVRFLMSTAGEQLVPFEELKPEDIVIVPAFGTTIEISEKLKAAGIDPQVYNATCPFVERVWKRSAQLGEQGYTVVIHGKARHEETRATFSHAQVAAASVIVRDISQAHKLAEHIRNRTNEADFIAEFGDLLSEGFDYQRDLNRIGVVNQTTMLAEETQAISELLKVAARDAFGEENLAQHFADTRDTLCYATSENQQAVRALVKSGGDLAIVIGGYNSSNTSHLVEICEEALPTFYIKDAQEILELNRIRHLNFHKGQLVETENWLPLAQSRIEILITAGASSPDALVEQVLERVCALVGLDDAFSQRQQSQLSALATS